MHLTLQNLYKHNTNACNKHTYSSENAADAARHHRLQSRNNPPEYLRAYYCSTCNGWHLTSQRNKHHVHEFTRNIRKIRHRWRQQLQVFLHTDTSVTKGRKEPELMFADFSERSPVLSDSIRTV